MAWWVNGFFRVLQFNIEDPYGFYAYRINADYLVELAKRVRANMLVVFARDAWGRVFYRRSKIYPRHPNSVLDLKELVEKARESGIRVIIMTNHTANRYLYRKHPNWAQRNINGEVIVLEHYPVEEVVKDPHWPQICPNSPALDHYFIPEVEEAVRETGADGVLLDSFRYMPDPPRACYCYYCRAKFRNEHGLDLPSHMDVEDSSFRIAWEWRYKVVVEAIRKLREAAKRVKPDAMFFYNSHPAGWAGRGNIVVEQARDYLDAVFAEASETDVLDYTMIAIATKLSRAVIGEGKPVFVSRNLFYALRTVQSSPPPVIRQGIRMIVASGGQPMATVFSGQVFEDPRALDVLAEVYEELERVGDYLVGLRPMDYAGIIFDADTHDKYYWRRPDIYVSEIEGFAEMLIHTHRPWSIVSMRDLSLPENLDRYPLLVAPSLAVVGDEEEKSLRYYVEKGGFLVASHEFGLMRPDYTYREALAMEDVLGVTYEGEFRFGYSFLYLGRPGEEVYDEYWKGMPESIIFGDHSTAFRRERAEPRLGDLIRAKPLGARVLAWGRLGRSAYGYEYTLGRSTPVPDSILNVAGITLNKHGEGSVLYYSVRLGAHYNRLGHPDYLQLLERPLERHAPPEPAGSDAPETVYIDYYRQGDRIIIHAVNLTSNQRILSAPTGPSKQALPPFAPSYSVHPARVILPVHQFNVWVRIEEGEYRVFDAVTGEDLNASYEDGRLVVRVPGLEEYRLIVVEPKS